MIKVPADSVSGEGLLPGSQTGVFWVSSHGRSGKRPLPGLIRAQAPLEAPNHLPKAPPPNTTTLGIRISIYESAESGWGDTNF